ncbi:MAG: CHASE domain-containing protein [Methylophaga sp.]|nr:CHASE domain-containing protein [Methylophaga sp.]
MVKTGRHLRFINKLIQHRFVPTVFAVIVLAVGLLISIALAQQIRLQQNEQITAALEFSADSALKNIQSLLETYTVVMHGVQGYFRGSEYIDFDEYAEYVGSLEVEDRLPGVQAINLAVKIRDEDKHKHLEEIRYWFSDYNIYPEGRRESYVPIVRTEPLNDENLKVLGLDLLTVPTA